MKAISILGTSSNAGKSWVSTALCAWLKSQGVRVAPFKSQNMANNAYATLEGGEIGVAQAVQAEACGLRPTAAMNPILLKPSSNSVSQIVRLGKAGEHIPAREFYRSIEKSWEVVTNTLDWWQDHCDVLVMEGAGSPVELNIMDRDIANLKPIRYVNGKWILVSNIELGGVFAQVIGTWNLLPDKAKGDGLGFLVNRFRGDIDLFSTASTHFESQLDLPYLGVLPLRIDLRIDDEDSMNAQTSRHRSTNPYIAWVRYPHISNTQDQLPWLNDMGIDSRWVDKPSELNGAAAIILPGSKSPFSDLEWLRQNRLDPIIHARAKSGIPIVGICGGFQMLCETLHDPQTKESANGLGLLPFNTHYTAAKTVTRRLAQWNGDQWETFEIHTGETYSNTAKRPPHLLKYVEADKSIHREGVLLQNIWGTYQHGIFESPSLRAHLIELANLKNVRIDQQNYRDKRQAVYQSMANLLEQSIDLAPIKRYLNL